MKLQTVTEERTKPPKGVTLVLNVILRNIYIMTAKSSSQMDTFFTQYLQISFKVNQFGQNILHLAERKFFEPNC